MKSFAGSFLVAKPMLSDPSFRRTVVLLLQHGPDGAFGLVVNRKSEVNGVPFPVYGGGPCKFDGLLMLHGHPEWTPTDRPPNEVAPGVYMGDESCMDRVNETDDGGESFRFRVFSGYSGWGAKQLESELDADVWTVLAASGDVLFDTPAEELWRLLVPPVLPQPSKN